MSKTLSITDDKVAQAIKDCPESKELLVKLFPDAAPKYALYDCHNAPNGWVQYDVKLVDAPYTRIGWVSYFPANGTCIFGTAKGIVNSDAGSCLIRWRTGAVNYLNAVYEERQESFDGDHKDYCNAVYALLQAEDE